MNKILSISEVSDLPTVNNALAEGWRFLAVQQRGELRDGKGESWLVYVLGHGEAGKELNAPKQEFRKLRL